MSVHLPITPAAAAALIRIAHPEQAVPFIAVVAAAVDLANGLEAERAGLSPANRKRLEDLQAAIEEAGKP